MPSSPRPNLLLIVTDQQRFDTIRALGNPHIRTPHLDWLVDTGVTFTRAYSDAPICVPARSTLITGLHYSSLPPGHGNFGQPTVPAATTAANLSVSPTALGSGFIATNYNGGNGLTGRDQTAMTLADAIALDDYVTFTVTPATGHQLTVTQLRPRPVSQNRVRTFTVMSSVGGFTTGAALGTFTTQANQNHAIITLPIAGVADQTEPVEFRIYVHGFDSAFGSVGLGVGAGEDLLVDGTITAVGSGGSGGSGFVQSGDGLLVMEAENAPSMLVGTGAAAGFDWVQLADGAASGELAMIVPNGASPSLVVATADASALEFPATFTQSGAHYLWVRARATVANGTDDSINYRLNDGALVRLNTANNTNWTWTRAGNTLNIPSTGQHTVSIYMRENGTQVDKLLLTPDAAYTPTGTGPAETQ